MKIIDNAVEVAKYSWSIKMNLLIALLSSFEAFLPMFDAESDWFSPRNLVALGTFFSSIGAALLRLVDQGLAKPALPELKDEEVLGV